MFGALLIVGIIWVGVGAYFCHPFLHPSFLKYNYYVAYGRVRPTSPHHHGLQGGEER
jgi:hypothetical protein